MSVKCSDLLCNCLKLIISCLVPLIRKVFSSSLHYQTKLWTLQSSTGHRYWNLTKMDSFDTSIIFQLFECWIEFEIFNLKNVQFWLKTGGDRFWWQPGTNHHQIPKYLQYKPYSHRSKSSSISWRIPLYFLCPTMQWWLQLIRFHQNKNTFIIKSLSSWSDNFLVSFLKSFWEMNPLLSRSRAEKANSALVIISV